MGVARSGTPSTERAIKAYFLLQVRPLKHCFIIYDLNPALKSGEGGEQKGGVGRAVASGVRSRPGLPLIHACGGVCQIGGGKSGAVWLLQDRVGGRGVYHLA